MSQNTNHSYYHQNQHAQSISKVWLYFMYYWIIFGIGCYLGQFLPLSWRQPLSFGLLIIILATLVFERARRFGLIISHIYAVVIGLLSYATFTTYLQNFRTRYILIKYRISNFCIYSIWYYWLFLRWRCIEYRQIFIRYINNINYCESELVFFFKILFFTLLLPSLVCCYFYFILCMILIV